MQTSHCFIARDATFAGTELGAAMVGSIGALALATSTGFAGTRSSVGAALSG